MNMHSNSIALRVIGLAAILSILSASAIANQVAEPSWTPKSSERLVKLPVPYLEKSIDHDFLESELGQAIGETEKNINSKGQTLSDLQETIKQTDKTELQLELQHQLLNEKREFVDLMIRKNELKRKKVDIKLQMFEGMMDKLAPGKGNIGPGRAALIEKQTAARTRFSNSLANVDMKIFESQSVPQSKYAEKYDENRRAMEKLMERISGHIANQAPLDEKGSPVSKSEYVRQMIAGTQAELALISQENVILGYMAKLIQLDALSLSEAAMGVEIADSDSPKDTTPAAAVKYFLGN